MATLRQKGAPTLFTTFSCAEFDWDELVQNIYQTVYKEKIDLETVKNKDTAWKNKLVSKNVVQSTIHFSKRTDKIMALLTTGDIFKHNDVSYQAESYFYRVEFQARGAPHIHCLIWLKGHNGESPPSMWDTNGNELQASELSEFGGSLISGSLKDMHCKNHEKFDP